MIQNHEIRKAAILDEVQSWSTLGDAKNDEACNGCVYYRTINQGHEQRACHYLIDNGKRRPCDPGIACTERKEEEYILD